MNKISIKLILLLILSALVPMTLFGIMAVWTARETARKIVMEENLEVAKQAANQIEQYVNNGVAILKALAQNLSKTDLLAWQKERIVRNYVLEFEEFQSIHLIDGLGQIVATSRFDVPSQDSSHNEAIRTATSGEVYRSGVFISKNFTPAMVVAVPVSSMGEVTGAVIGEFNLIEMWRLVDSIRIGEEGYAFVVSKEGFLIAHGLGSAKARVLRQEHIGPLSIAEAVLKGKTEGMIYRDERGIKEIGVSVPIPSLGWGFVIEQPTREAYAAATRLTFELTFLVAVFLLLMVLIGTVGGRRYIVTPIRELIRGTRTVGGGNLSDKVEIRTRDEFRELGDAFNVMTERLLSLKENIRRNERAVFLGRIASGLVHDLRHPIRNLENSSRLVIRDFDDPKIRDLFQRNVYREFANLNRFLENLLHLSNPTSIRPVLLNLPLLIGEILEFFRSDSHCVIEEPDRRPIDPAKDGKVHICVRMERPNLKIWADRFALERVLRNLIANAIEAMPQVGRLLITARIVPSEQSLKKATEISISDTGGGIQPDRLKHLFADFTTTKHRGIGLGLAICKKIMEEHKATIDVESRLDQGTILTLQFPLPA